MTCICNCQKWGCCCKSACIFIGGILAWTPFMFCYTILIVGYFFSNIIAIWQICVLADHMCPSLALIAIPSLIVLVPTQIVNWQGPKWEFGYRPNDREQKERYERHLPRVGHYGCCGYASHNQSNAEDDCWYCDSMIITWIRLFLTFFNGLYASVSIIHLISERCEDEDLSPGQYVLMYWLPCQYTFNALAYVFISPFEGYYEKNHGENHGPNTWCN